MESTKQNKGVFLFLYLIVGFVISAVLVIGLEPSFSSHLQSLWKMWIVVMLVAALLGFFLSKSQKKSLKMLGYVLSIVVFTILILFLHQLFAVGHRFKTGMFFFGAAMAGELVIFVITLISPAKKIYAGIGGAVCVVISGLALCGFADGNLKAVACVVLSLAYLYISSLYYLEYDDPENSELLEKSGMIFNIVAFFLALYGRYTYSWRR